MAFLSANKFRKGKTNTIATPPLMQAQAPVRRSLKGTLEGQDRAIVWTDSGAFVQIIKSVSRNLTMGARTSSAAAAAAKTTTCLWRLKTSILILNPM